MGKILGLDLGTNSIGWAVVETEDKKTFQLVDKGVRIFQEGVKIEKGVESSKAAERTNFRSARRLKYRRKLRKIETLKVLNHFAYCPALSATALNNWRYKKQYPVNEAFMNWQKTDEATQKNPYHYRALAVEQKLDLSNETERFMLGRAFYHMAQRRGFLSNRLESTKESNGAVIQAIDEISHAKGELTLGQYFSNLYRNGEKIRNHYTHREKHYLEEFERICEVQQLPNAFVQQLKKAIFYQRPLRSQKGAVGTCPFEKNKSRCPVSHPAFEMFRMYSFVNNIKIKMPDEDGLRELNDDEKELIAPLFFRKSKEHFNFEDIAKKLTPKGWPYSYYKERNKHAQAYWYNFSMKTSVSGCRTITQLKEVFGDDWENGIAGTYTNTEQKTGSKTIDEMVTDVWHVLFSFDKTEKLFEFAQKRLKLGNEKAEKFSKISLKQDYASLSLKAIRKIVPYLEEGLIYSHAVFMAKLEDLIPTEIWNDESNQKLIREEIYQIIRTQNREKQLVELVNGIIKINRDDRASWSENEYWLSALKNDIDKKLLSYFGSGKWESFAEEEKEHYRIEVFRRVKNQMQNNLGRGEFAKTQAIDERVKVFIEEQFGIDPKKLDKLYHPSAIEVYNDAQRAPDGNYYLGSPMIASVRNPMAMRALHQLRRVINELIKEGTVDRDTKINIEMARDLKNANERKALQRWQRARENEKEKYWEQLKKDIKAATGRDAEPSERDVLKYQLWEEQNHICLYTGANIGISEFIGDNPKYDIEHTIPRSMSFDNSQVNLTLCDSSYNRNIKRNKIPSELPDHAEIVERLKHWEDRIEEAREGIEKAVRQSRANSDNKEAKDNAIQKRHMHQLDLDYWNQKYKRFLMEDVPEGFKNSQLVDTGIITKYARLYLKTVFNNVYTVKGKTVADFRKLWGIQEEFEKKERVNHIHHCIDAITMACMTKEAYEELAKAYHDWEEMERINTSEMPPLEKPWPTFTEDLKNIENEVLISHYTPDSLPKSAKKKLRVRGKIQRDQLGNVIYQKGDSVRGSLHKDTNYGAIKRTVSNKGKTEEQIVYAVRKPLDSLTASDIKNIVDDRIRAIVEKGKSIEPGLKSALEKTEKRLRDAESSELQEQLVLEVARIKKEIDSLYAIPNQDGSFTPIKKVRCIAKTVTSPLHPEKTHRDLSDKEYKHHSYFVNDGNYMMALYEGNDKKGALKRDFILVNNMEAGAYFNGKTSENLVPGSHPVSGFSLKYLLKTGTMVLLWQDSPEEVWEILNEEDSVFVKELKKRLYKVIGMSVNTIRQGDKSYKFGNVVLKSCHEARPYSELKTQDGLFNKNEAYVPQRKFSHIQINALVEGFDFKISPTGKLIKLEKQTPEGLADASGAVDKTNLSESVGPERVSSSE